MHLSQKVRNILNIFLLFFIMFLLFLNVLLNFTVKYFIVEFSLFCSCQSK